VIRDGQASFVWRVQNERVERVAVRTGGEREGQIDILAGVNAGEVVVTAPLEGLEDGARVRLRTGQG
jgi:membrane fusion protein (multidrug efflux system)